MPSGIRHPNVLIRRPKRVNASGTATVLALTPFMTATRGVLRGFIFDISRKDFWLLTSQPCFVCAAPPSRGRSKRHKNPYLYNGIDRVNSAEGYRLGNVVGCCWDHNRIKGDLTHQEFFGHCLGVVLSELSKTATSNNDILTLERLIDLFPNVRFLQEHHRHVWAELRRNPRALVLTPEMALPPDLRGIKRYPDRPRLTVIGKVAPQ